ncbi:sulfite exporter TauE/SafE family protein [Hypericibacter sp.]|uniref:sulfite exporter TauE/SafE family protein n=1 Tax=Hypericibacter sp. TaxID=2705401 RepID=UPI003D6D33B6
MTSFIEAIDLGGMNAALISFSLVCVLGAAVVRGFSGFGFSLLSITALSLVMEPAAIVPSIFMLEVAASLPLLPGIWRDIHWRSIGWLLLGYTVFVPIGVWLLANAPVAPMKLALGIFVIATAIMLLRGFALKQMPSRVATLAAGGASGLLNGAFGIGGPPVVLFYFSSPAGAAAGRASIIAFFIATDLLGLGFQAREGLITGTSFWRFLLFLPPLLIGVWIGNRGFKSVDPALFRRIVLWLLVVLAVLTAAQGLFQLWSGPGSAEI